ncbi:MAG: hypothetical protein Q8O67_00815 [Deltaproteobacteria bacterium]|nr:hypothetical protein [Deltaproteobacteria bacterium]
MKKHVVVVVVVVAIWALAAQAGGKRPYNQGAGSNAPAKAIEQRVTVDKDTGKREVEDVVVNRPIQRDGNGNAQGSQYDLAVDGAFDGQTVAVLHFYPFDFSAPQAALKEKGFSVFRWISNPPPPAELETSLQKANQLWVISDCSGTHLNAEHVAVIKRYFESGHGVYIWGDNNPCYGDANLVGKALLGVEMLGDVPGDQVVGIQKNGKGAGVVANHLISTGVETVYEGVTVATIEPNQQLTPLLYGSAGNLIAAAYDKEKRRLIFDGGFTRLYGKWDTAGTARYIKNAAAWLANVERFGDAIVADQGVSTKTAKP